MAIAVADNNLVVINSCDALDASRFNIGAGVNNPNTADTAIFAEGTASWRARVTGTGVGGVGDDFGGSTNIEGKHIMCWGRSLDVVAVTDGWRLRWAASANGLSTHLVFSAGGLDTVRSVFKGFFNFCVDPLGVNKVANGAPPTLATARSFALEADHQSASSRDTFFIDEIKVMSGITVTGGAAVPRGAPEIAANDATNGRGTFIDINGVFYILGDVVIGDVTAATNSTFEDGNNVWVFQAGSMSASFHRLTFIGGTGTNAATFGTLVGSGITAVGVSGNTFLSAGLVPFSVVCEDADIAVAFYGCSLLGPPALMVENFREVLLDNGTVFSDQTIDAVRNTPNATNMLIQPASVNQAFYLAHDFPFSNGEIDVRIAHNGTFTVVYEYWNGSSWVGVPELDDASLDFQTTGVKKATWEIPGDWAKNSVNAGVSYYHVRIRIDAVTTAGTISSSGTSVRVDIGGVVELVQANADMISCTLTNMDMITIRNGALFRKCNVIASVSSIRNGAIDLGSADPATDSFRDISVQNCNIGIQVRPTLTGKITYNFRNITFAGNTFDVLNSGIATVRDSYAVSNQDATTALNNVVHGVGQSFAGAADTLSRVQFYLSKTLTPTGNAVAKVYAHSGVKGTSSVPTGPALATSEPVDVSTLTGTLTLTDFEFRDEFLMSAATDYVVTLEYTGGTAANTVNVGTDTSAPTHAGNFSTADTLFAWTAVAGTDGIFEVRSGAIAIINVLQGGGTPTVKTLNGATIVNNTVTLTVQVNDPNGTAVSGARVRIERASDGALITDGETNVSGTFTDATFNFTTDLDVVVKVRLKSFKFFRTTGTITSSGLTVGVRFEPNKIVDLP